MVFSFWALGQTKYRVEYGPHNSCDYYAGLTLAIFYVLMCLVFVGAVVWLSIKFWPNSILAFWSLVVLAGVAMMFVSTFGKRIEDRLNSVKQRLCRPVVID